MSKEKPPQAAQETLEARLRETTGLLEVAWVVKLRWVNENADHDNLIFPAASFHERTVPPVKRSHCRDETNTALINGASTCPPGSQSVGNVH